MNSPVRPLIQGLTVPAAQELMQAVTQNLAVAVFGKPVEARLAVTCLVASGHLLLEDVPGVGKTTFAESLSRSFGLLFARIQFTADLMPADVVGVQIFQASSGTFQFRAGPLFHPLVLADELNRAPPRTQSALLEAMAQGQVSVDGVTHPLPKPFIVVATQNPVDLAGTYPLPDSQLDRFLMRMTLGHPSTEVETQLLMARGQSSPLESLKPVATAENLLELQALAAKAHVDQAVARYAVDLVEATRRHPQVERGASTRAALGLMAAAKAEALWEARDFVTPKDVRTVLTPVLAHRLLMRASVTGAFSRDEAGHVLEEIARKNPPPR